MVKPLAGSAKAPIAIGAGISAGFGVLALLWFTRGALWAAPPAQLPGLFDYPSAYIGDSVLIPAAAATMAAGVKRLRPVRREPALVLVATILALAAAVAMQVVWLADRQPRSNWTSPTPHHFNIAGWWHAVFFVVVSVIVMILATSLFARLGAAVRGPGRQDAEAMLRGPWPPVVSTCLLAYALLVVHDSVEATTLSTSSSVAGLSIAATGFFVGAGAALGRSWTLLMRPLLIGVTAAATLALLIFAS